MINLDALEQAARAATPGPWHLQTDHCDCGGDYPCAHGEFPYELYAPARQVVRWHGELRSARLCNFPEAGDATMADAQFMELANPATVLALIARLRAAEALITFMDARLPLADATCDGPGITFSEACRREMLADAQGDEPSPKERAAMRAALEATRPAPEATDALSNV